MNNYNFDTQGMHGAALVEAMDYVYRRWVRQFEAQKLAQIKGAEPSVVVSSAPAVGTQLEPCPAPCNG